MSRHIDRFRLPAAVAVAATMALAVCAPASAAPSHNPQLLPITHGMPALPHSHLPWLSAMPPESIARSFTGIPTYELTSSYANAKTVNGVPWSESLFASKDTSTSATSAGIELIRHNSSFSQYADNAWTFTNLPTTDLNVSGENATLTVTSPQIAPFGSLSAKFTAKETYHAKCSSGSQTVYTGVLTVTSETFVTKNTKEEDSTLGTVAATNLAFPNTSTNISTLAVWNNCTPVYPTTPIYCTVGSDWGTPWGNNSPSTYFVGSNTTTESPTPATVASVEAGRTVNLGRLTTGHGSGGGAVSLSRFDDVWDQSVTNQTNSEGSGSQHPMTEKITTPSGDPFLKGSATMTSKTSSNFPYGSCKAGSATKTQQWGASNGVYSWTNGSTPLTAYSAVGARISYGNLTNVDNGSIDRWSY